MVARTTRPLLSVTVVLAALAAPVVLHAEPQAPSDPPPAGTASASPEALLQEIRSVRPPAFDSSRRQEPGYARTYAGEYEAAMKKRAALAERFADAFPDHDQAPDMLLVAAQMSRSNPDRQMALYRRIVERYPNSQAADSARGPIRQIEGVGKPFELSFTDAIGGKPVSMADLKGKVVVVDFWATWCGPCVAEMPKMRDLYAKYHGQGVEFVGVSLDQPGSGLEKLKEFVSRHDIRWPQYYQGKGWESEFSRSWGINSIPRLFIVDADGNLHSTEARGRLEQLIPELLAKRDKKTASAR